MLIPHIKMPKHGIEDLLKTQTGASRTPLSDHASAAVAVLLLVLALSGCSDPEEGAGGPVEPTSSVSTPTEVEPATGPLLRTKAVRLRAPERWRRAPAILSDSAAADTVDGSGSILLFDGSQIGNHTLDQLVRYERGLGSWEGRADRGPDADLDGVSAYAIEGREVGGLYNYKWGVEAYDRDVRLVLTLDVEIPARKRDDIAASVLASFEWTAD